MSASIWEDGSDHDWSGCDRRSQVCREATRLALLEERVARAEREAEAQREILERLTRVEAILERVEASVDRASRLRITVWIAAASAGVALLAAVLPVLWR